MTKNETIQLLTLLSSNYKSIDDKLKDRDKAKMLLEIWHECLGDLDYKLCMFAVKKAIMSSSYPPTIHDIRSAATSIVKPQESDKTAIEYWNEAYKMIRKGSYMTTEEFEKHSEPVKRFFGSVAQVKELALTDADTVNTVTKGQFLKQIDVIQEREKEMELLPAAMRDTISNLKIGQASDTKQLRGELK
ncbi:MAG: replicative helicase loader/inhibitor [Clostridium sp.]|uniref:replicative helicase loader/inhibitor n=1 Tax=Clostridium culturomicium TaxID=1499683 RepID=UPI002907E710|nr:replicative helicase loader/inhibitor [Clostridium sp.]MDU7085621.1 replicative helicase loader/inhibitor [Clostridium sp.]